MMHHSRKGTPLGWMNPSGIRRGIANVLLPLSWEDSSVESTLLCLSCEKYKTYRRRLKWCWIWAILEPKHYTDPSEDTPMCTILAKTFQTTKTEKDPHMFKLFKLESPFWSCFEIQAAFVLASGITAGKSHPRNWGVKGLYSKSDWFGQGWVHVESIAVQVQQEHQQMTGSYFFFKPQILSWISPCVQNTRCFAAKPLWALTIYLKYTQGTSQINVSILNKTTWGIV